MVLPINTLMGTLCPSYIFHNIWQIPFFWQIQFVMVKHCYIHTGDWCSQWLLLEPYQWGPAHDCHLLVPTLHNHHFLQGPSRRKHGDEKRQGSTCHSMYGYDIKLWRIAQQFCHSTYIAIMWVSGHKTDYKFMGIWVTWMQYILLLNHTMGI